jgi:hypothetical protein
VTLVRTDDGCAISVVGDAVELLRYCYRPSTPANLSPRPFVHPLRTLAGRVVTADRPSDHPWHQGLSLAVPDVGGTNFWGGSTFVRGEGYRSLDDHGRIVHVSWDGPVERLNWLSRDDRAVVDERRAIEAVLVTRGWALAWRSTLTNVSGGALRFATPEGNGRVDGGYGGLFWRAADGFRDARTADGTAAQGSAATWVALGDDSCVVVLERLVPTPAPWFVRVDPYPGACFPFGAPSFSLDAGATLEVGGRLRIYDGPLDSVPLVG